MRAIFKKFSTHQERSFYFLHRIGYKSYSLNIRVARGTGLAQVWDEFPTYVSLYTTNFTEPLSYQDSAFLKLPKFP